MYEAEYEELGVDVPLNSTCYCMVLLLTCLGGMRGYQAICIDLANLGYDLLYYKSLDDFLAVAWPIIGRLKAHEGRAGCYMISIADVTNSRINFFG